MSAAAGRSRLNVGLIGLGRLGRVYARDLATRDRLRYVLVRNEQAMVHTAVAYAKRLNRMGAWACTTSIGPGATNLTTGAATATVNRLPVLLLPGDIFATRRRGAGRSRGPIPELRHLVGRAGGRSVDPAGSAAGAGGLRGGAQALSISDLVSTRPDRWLNQGSTRRRWRGCAGRGVRPCGGARGRAPREPDDIRGASGGRP